MLRTGGASRGSFSLAPWLMVLAMCGVAGPVLVSCAPTTPRPETDPFEAVEQERLGPGGRPYIVFDGKRYMTGPYGEPDAIKGVIAALKRHGRSKSVSARALALPNTPASLVFRIYAFQFPEECGAHQFNVLDGGQFLILEYHHLQEDDELVQIRDYVRGPNPFVASGLWGPYDHTSDAKLDMCLLPGNSRVDGFGFMKAGYEIGWVTTLAKWKQVDLGVVYKEAVGAANGCVDRLDAGAFEHLYDRP